MTKKKVIAILGKAGSGKDTIAKLVTETSPHFNYVISSTTRPKRDYEINGKDYYFVSEEEFLELNLIEKTKFNNWFYGTSYDSLDANKYNIAIVNPDGLNQIIKHPSISLEQIYYIDTNDKERLLRQLDREKNPNVSEIIRRFQTDNLVFDNFLTEMKTANIELIFLNNSDIGDLKNNVNYIVGKIK